MEVRVGESAFTTTGLEDHHLKQVIQLSVTSIGAARPNASSNIMQIELNNITFEILHLNLIKPLEPLLVVYKEYMRVLRFNSTRRKQSDKARIQGHFTGQTVLGSRKK